MSMLLRLGPDDDVAVVRREVAAGDELEPGLLAGQAIPAGHKAAVRDLSQGAAVRKYGQVIGITTRPVRAGEHVHTDNLAFIDDGPGEAGVRAQGVTLTPPADLPRTFLGHHRADGRVGTRNSIAILTTVNCSAGWPGRSRGVRTTWSGRIPAAGSTGWSPSPTEPAAAWPTPVPGGTSCAAP